MKLGDIDMPVKTITGVCALAVIGVSGAGKALEHWELPKANAVKLVEHESRQEAIQSSLNKLVLDKIIEICSERYTDIHDCPEYKELTKPEGFNLLGKERPSDPKVRSEG